MTYYHGVLDFCESFKEPIPFLPLTLPSKIFINKAFNRQFDILNSFRPQPPFIWKLIQELDSFPQTFQCPSNIPSTPQVLKAKRFLSDKLILSAPDKNSGIPDLYCPTILWENMRSSFWCNIHFQKQPHLSEQSILSYFKYTFDANNWNLYGSFNVHGSAPYPYMNRKFKDLSRNRGIISYFHHPLKDIYFRAAAGLMTCLKALDFFHTNLFNPMQALPTMKLLFLYLNNKFGSETVFHSWAADVKEMYDWLPQSDIRYLFFAQLNGCSHISPKNIEEIQLLSFLKRQNVAELENHINQMNLSTFLLKKSSGSVSLKLLMHTLFSTRLCSFNF